jgi:hypothetical protein
MRQPRVSTRSLKSFIFSSLSSTMSTVFGMGGSAKGDAAGALVVGEPR